MFFRTLHTVLCVTSFIITSKSQIPQTLDELQNQSLLMNRFDNLNNEPITVPQKYQQESRPANTEPNSSNELTEVVSKPSEGEQAEEYKPVLPHHQQDSMPANKEYNKPTESTQVVSEPDGGSQAEDYNAYNQVLPHHQQDSMPANKEYNKPTESTQVVSEPDGGSQAEDYNAYNPVLPLHQQDSMPTNKEIDKPTESTQVVSEPDGGSQAEDYNEYKPVQESIPANEEHDKSNNKTIQIMVSEPSNGNQTEDYRRIWERPPHQPYSLSAEDNDHDKWNNKPNKSLQMFHTHGGVRSKEDENLPECKSVYSCSDCYTARICRPTLNGTFEHVQSIKCPPKTPHCDFDSGTCRWQASRVCVNPDNFICLSDGHFPDTDCRFYHVCSNLTAEKRQCEHDHQYYNADRGVCDFQTEHCGFFDCFQQTPGSKTPYTTSLKYFGYCDGKKSPSVIDRCPEGTLFNMTSQVCETMCSEREGVIEDPFDCRKYYKCTKTWISMAEWYMTKERKDCPQGTGFDRNNFLCVSLEQHPSCRTDRPQLTQIPLPKNTQKQQTD